MSKPKGTSNRLLNEALHQVRVFNTSPWWANLVGSLRPSLSTPQAQIAFRRFSDKSFTKTGQGGLGFYFERGMLDSSSGGRSSEGDGAGSSQRLLRYADYSQMDEWPELKSAMDIYADEVTQRDEDGDIIKVKCESAALKLEIEEFLVRLGVEGRLWHWVRETCKMGDKFVVLKIKIGEGVIDIIDDTHPSQFDKIQTQVPVEEYDESVHNIEEAATATVTAFRWKSGVSGVAAGALYQSSGSKSRMLTELDVLHFMVKGKTEHFPYGTSELDAARHHWRRLSHMEDAVFIYRLIRAPARRVFNVETGTMNPDDVAKLIKREQDKLRTSSSINQETGQINKKMTMATMEQDFWVPMKDGKKSVEIDVAESLAYQNDIEDIKMIQDHLFAATKVPRAFMSYEETINAKATLSAQDVRFGRSVQRIQDVALEQLYKLVMLHLYFKRSTIEQTEFTLELTPSSLVTRMQNLEMMSERLTVAGTAGDLLPRKYVLQKILGLTDAEIEEIMEIESSGDMRSGAASGGGGISSSFGEESGEDSWASEPEADEQFTDSINKLDELADGE